MAGERCELAGKVRHRSPRAPHHREETSSASRNRDRFPFAEQKRSDAAEAQDQRCAYEGEPKSETPVMPQIVDDQGIVARYGATSDCAKSGVPEVFHQRRF
jgi:hypothetical protein